MRITKWGEYAILFCIYLARREADMPPAGATEIGGAYDIPTQYAQQILHRLRKGNIIRSIRGPHGGFKLQKRAEDTNLKDILYAAEGATFEIICNNSDNSDTCARMTSGCSLKFVWHDLKRSVDKLLEETTLASLVQKQVEIQKDPKLIAVPKRAIAESIETVSN